MKWLLSMNIMFPKKLRAKPQNVTGLRDFQWRLENCSSHALLTFCVLYKSKLKSVLSDQWNCIEEFCLTSISDLHAKLLLPRIFRSKNIRLNSATKIFVLYKSSPTKQQACNYVDQNFASSNIFGICFKSPESFVCQSRID